VNPQATEHLAQRYDLITTADEVVAIVALVATGLVIAIDLASELVDWHALRWTLAYTALRYIAAGCAIALAIDVLVQ
jgi:cytochrome b subunit of formate dehydrogenase